MTRRPSPRNDARDTLNTRFAAGPRRNFSHHLRQGDDSRWFGDVIEYAALADEARETESDASLSANENRKPDRGGDCATQEPDRIRWNRNPYKTQRHPREGGGPVNY